MFKCQPPDSGSGLDKFPHVVAIVVLLESSIVVIAQATDDPVLNLEPALRPSRHSRHRKDMTAPGG